MSDEQKLRNSGTSQEESATNAAAPPAEDEDSGITLIDVLEEEEQLEQDADAVLGGSDDQNCTYSKGYVKRQALYSCLTCIPDGSQQAGICLACCYHCHDGHELIELYTKRNFCCDCGNSKFPNNKCTLQPVKDSVNEKNQYNANFGGKYCTCLKPYPDPEDDQPDEMIQCVTCEDWFHLRHLGQRPPKDYSEMICDTCIKRHSFLQPYFLAFTDGVYQKLDSSDLIYLCFFILVILKYFSIFAGFSFIIVLHESDCVFEKLNEQGTVSDSPKATYWPSGWRTKLCRCAKCMALYQESKLEFLLDVEDTVEFYEDRGLSERAAEAPKTHNEKLMTALSSLDRTQQVELIHGYQSFSTDLKDYLRKFAENKKVVREEDIREFFSQLAARKKQRSGASVPFFCR
nr:EOG090X07TK [Eulimnadia texana]